MSAPANQTDPAVPTNESERDLLRKLSGYLFDLGWYNLAGLGGYHLIFLARWAIRGTPPPLHWLNIVGTIFVLTIGLGSWQAARNFRQVAETAEAGRSDLFRAVESLGRLLHWCGILAGVVWIVILMFAGGQWFNKG